MGDNLEDQVLSNPEVHILDPGGHILLARQGEEIIGTAALIRAGRGRVELSKMAVTERYQGLGIARRLLAAAIALFERSGSRQLFLESSHKLGRAIALCEANGFRHAPRPPGSPHYQRSDVYMVYRPPGGQRRTKDREVRTEGSERRRGRNEGSG